MELVQGIPPVFERDSVVGFWERRGFGRFLSGHAVTPREIDAEDWECLTIADGICLVSHMDYLWCDELDLLPTRIPLLVNNLFLGSFRDGKLARVGAGSLAKVLALLERSPRWVTKTIAMDQLGREMRVLQMGRYQDLGTDGPDPFIQQPGSYMRLWQSGSFIGILNRALCCTACGTDVVWIENDLCRLWIHMEGALFSVAAIRLLPFRVDRSGRSGPMLMRREGLGSGVEEQWCDM